MTDFLIVRLQDDAPVEWMVVDDEGARKSETGSGSLAEAAAAAAGRRVIALMPSLDVITLRTDLPVKGSKLLAALPYALEDQLADDVDVLHFAPGKREADGSLPVAVASKDRIEHWQDQLATVGLTAQRLVPEYHGVVAVPNTLSMLISGDVIMFNDGCGLHYAISGSTPLDLIAASGYIEKDGADDTEAPRALVVYCDEASEERFSQDWLTLRHELDSVDIHRLTDGPLSRLAIPVATGAGINLLQGLYAEKTEFRAAFRPWRTAAALFGVLLFAGLAGKAADFARLGEEEAALREQFNSLYREIRPNDQREVLDPVSTVRSIERSLTGGTALPVFLPSMQALANALQNNGPIAIEAINYRAGVIDIRLTVTDVATLDKIQKAVNASSRFAATIQSTTQAEGGVESRLQIREAGA
jgi:general secretion pathway protein L